MNPHIKSLSITPLIKKFPVISLHNSPCCFHLLPTALEVIPVLFVAGSYTSVQECQPSTRPHFLLLTVIHFPAKTTRSKQTSICCATTQQFWNNWKTQKFSEVIHLSLFVASPHSLFFHKDRLGSFHSLVSSYIFIYSLHVLASHFWFF